MPAADDLAVIVAEWVARAEGDLKTALQTLKLKSQCPTETVAFHAQQCVEKYTKAMLIWSRIDFPKTHNIRHLVEMLPESSRPSISVHDQNSLTPYAVEARYPGDFEPVSLTEARQVVALARQVRGEIRKMLPPSALRPRSKLTGLE